MFINATYFVYFEFVMFVKLQNLEYFQQSNFQPSLVRYSGLINEEKLSAGLWKRYGQSGKRKFVLLTSAAFSMWFRFADS